MIPYKMLAKVSLNVMILYELILKKTRKFSFRLNANLGGIKKYLRKVGRMSEMRKFTLHKYVHMQVCENGLAIDNQLRRNTAQIARWFVLNYTII